MSVTGILPILDLTDPAQQQEYADRIRDAVLSAKQVVTAETLAKYLVANHFVVANDLCTALAIEVYTADH
ncbi:hypothetical protein [Fibrella forsythiae]|uniref:Uncharacterized protein n=1 Tax=Fibrella forsythiae TaxID=2817061 RepID=A0ABS3JAG3_9BACT|nr:hypothetical protein [Fibrella forsythiae]MBO0946975.1 hypothetical protein [Fibrella forsythiae]